MRCIAILNAEGLRPDSLGGSALNITIHWSNVVSDKTIKLDMAIVAIGKSIEVFPDPAFWFRTFEDPRKICDSRIDTDNGPDGRVHGVRKVIPDACIAKLYNRYVNLLEWLFSLTPRGVELGNSSLSVTASKFSPEDRC